MHANPLIEFMEGFFVMLTTAFVQRNMLSGLNPHIAPDLVPRGVLLDSDIGCGRFKNCALRDTWKIVMGMLLCMIG